MSRCGAEVMRDDAQVLNDDAQMIRYGAQVEVTSTVMCLCTRCVPSSDEAWMSTRTEPRRAATTGMCTTAASPARMNTKNWCSPNDVRGLYDRTYTELRTRHRPRHVNIV